MATTATVPVMFSFGIEYNVSCFWLVEVDREETLAHLVNKFGPDDWGDISTHIWVKVSHSKSGTYDKFNLNNTVGLVLRVLKSDVLWIKFEKSLPPPSKQVPKNAFKLFFNAQNKYTHHCTIVFKLDILTHYNIIRL